jgi:hypothetical protein
LELSFCLSQQQVLLLLRGALGGGGDGFLGFAQVVDERWGQGAGGAARERIATTGQRGLGYGRGFVCFFIGFGVDQHHF